MICDGFPGEREPADAIVLTRPTAAGRSALPLHSTPRQTCCAAPSPLSSQRHTRLATPGAPGHRGQPGTRKGTASQQVVLRTALPCTASAASPNSIELAHPSFAPAQIRSAAHAAWQPVQFEASQLASIHPSISGARSNGRQPSPSSRCRSSRQSRTMSRCLLRVQIVQAASPPYQSADRPPHSPRAGAGQRDGVAVSALQQAPASVTTLTALWATPSIPLPPRIHRFPASR
jgi:hypothetical protein